MEKIEDKNFVTNLKKNRTLYNDLFSMYLVKYPNLDGEVVLRFVSEKIAPAMALYGDSNGTQYESLFRYIYEKTLGLAGSMKLERAFDGFGNLILIPGLLKDICNGDREELLNSLFSASENILRFSGDKFSLWSLLLQKMARENNIKSIDEFLNAGRFAAWVCGMAGLREKVIESDPVPEDIVAFILKESVKLNELSPSWDEIEISPWLVDKFENRFDFKYPVSGFRGFDGHFIRPPVTAFINGRFFATDGEKVFLVFADIFGADVTEIFTVDPAFVINESLTSIPSHINCFIDDDSIPFNDIRSIAITNHTVIISRDSSHKLFVFGNRD